MYGSRTRVFRSERPGSLPLEEHDVVRTAGIEPAISGASGRRSAAELRAHRAGGESRTHLEQFGRLPPHRSASPAVVPPVGLEPTHFRVRTGCSAFELRRRCRSDVACDALHTCHPLESNQDLLGFSQARRPTTQEWHREAWVRLVVIEFICHAPSAPCRCRSAVSACSGNRRFTCAAVGCSSG